MSREEWIVRTRQAATRAGVDPDLFVRLIEAESSFDPDVISGRRVSSAGAKGIAQLMPVHWSVVDPTNPEASLNYAARMLSDFYRRYGSWELALAAYNAGPGSVEKYGGVPPYQETRAYVSKIMGSRSSGKAPGMASPSIQAQGDPQMSDPINGNPFGDPDANELPGRFEEQGWYVWKDKRTGKVLWWEAPITAKTEPVQPVKQEGNDGSIHYYNAKNGDYLWTARAYDPSNDPRVTQSKNPVTENFPDRTKRQWNPQTGGWDIIGESPVDNKPPVTENFPDGTKRQWNPQTEDWDVIGEAPPPKVPQRAPRWPEEVERDRLEVEKLRRELIPTQIRMIQEGYAAIDQAKRMMATGQLTPEEGDRIMNLTRQQIDAALRGTTPWQMEQEKMRQRQSEQELGSGLLRQRVSSATQMGQFLLTAAMGLRMPKGQSTLNLNPLAIAKAFTDDMMGGAEIPSYAKNLLVGAGVGSPAGPVAGSPQPAFTPEEQQRRIREIQVQQAKPVISGDRERRLLNG